jgi:hypothetical protein
MMFREGDFFNAIRAGITNLSAALSAMREGKGAACGRLAFVMAGIGNDP